MTGPPYAARSSHRPPDTTDTWVSTSSPRSSPNPPTEGASWQLAHAAELNDGPNPVVSVNTRVNTARPRLNRSSSACVRPGSGTSSCASSDLATLVRAVVGDCFGADGAGLSVQAT